MKSEISSGLRQFFRCALPGIFVTLLILSAYVAQAESRKGELSGWDTAYELYRGESYSEAYTVLNALTEEFQGVKLYKIFKDRRANFIGV